MTTRSEELVVDGRRVRWRVAGSGPPLVCIHGLAGSWRWWTPVLPALAERHEVHLVDVPRFSGLSRFRPDDASDWLGRWLAAAALVRPALVGHSLGGLLCAQVATRVELGKLVLVDPAGIPEGRGLPRQAFALVPTLRGARPRFLAVLALDSLRWGPESILRGYAYATGADLRAELSRIAVPTLVIWGERDALLPARLAQEWCDAIPGAQLVMVPRAGHVPMYDAPAEFSRTVLAFLGEEGADELGHAGRRAVVRGVSRARDDDEPSAR